MKSLRLWLLALLTVVSGSAVSAQQKADAAERHFELLTVGELAFTNVWVHRQTNYNILIRHSGGIHTIKLTDLPDKELAALKSQIGDLAAMDEPKRERSAASWLEKLKQLAAGASPQVLALGGAALVLFVILMIALARRRGSSAPPA